MAKKRKGLGPLVAFIVIPLIAIDGYAYYRLNEVAGHPLLSTWDNSIASSMNQLAIILAINIAVIIILLFYIALFK